MRRLVLLLSLTLAACPTTNKPNRGNDTATDDSSAETTPDTTPDTTAVQDAAAESLAQLRARSQGPVTLSVRRGIPDAVFLDVPVGTGDPIDEAYAFLEEFAPFYALSSPRDQLHPRSAKTDAYGTHIRFVQRTLPDQGGLPLFNSGLTIHIAEGRIYLTTGRYLPGLTVPAPTLNAQEALEGLVIEPELRGMEMEGEARLGVYASWGDEGEPTALHTVWRMTITGDILATGEPVFWRVDVDALTGEVVHIEELAATCDKDFDIMYGYHDSSDSCWIFASTEDWFDEDGSLDDYSVDTDHNNDGINGFNNAHTVYDYYNNTFDQCSYDDGDAEVEMVMHTTVVGNASANGFCGTMQFNDGFAGLDVVAHEFTHLVDYNANNLEYEGQSGALDESFADVFGSFVDGDWTIVGRNLANPPAAGHPDHMLASVSGDNIGLRSTSNPNKDNDWGDVHTNSGIPNKAAFLITDGDTHNGYPVVGLGQDKSQVLYHAVHISGLEDNADFVDARNALAGTAQSWGTLGWFGFDANDDCSVANAFASVGVSVSGGDIDCDGTADGGDGDDDNDGTSDGNDNCPMWGNPGQGDLDSDGQGDSCDDDIDGDGDLNESDNCIWTSNSNQTDSDGDGVGNVCDDGDHDGVLDINDNCPTDANWDQQDTNNDGQGDVCDNDIDGDGDINTSDNCPSLPNSNQADGDGDNVGDVCDNCPTTSNEDQEDCDNDGIGAACDPDIFEALGCFDLFEAEFNAFVHPLDIVSLPHVSELEVTRLSDDYQLQVSVIGTTEPWMITDHFGNVVARSEAIEVGGREATARFTPALDYHYVEAAGRADFATTYSLSISPLGGDVQLDVLIEGVEQ